MIERVKKKIMYEEKDVKECLESISVIRKNLIKLVGNSFFKDASVSNFTISVLVEELNSLERLGKKLIKEKAFTK